MKSGNRNKSSFILFNTYLWSLLIAWTVIIGGLLTYGIFQITRIQREMAQKEAWTNFNKDQALRLWAAMHGGVYVPVTEGTPPNPHLSHVPERDIKTPGGVNLTLMNPAYMLRQTMDKYETEYGIRGHITSLKHFRIETAPDEWEKHALQEFDKGIKEVSEFTEIEGRPYFRFMSAMVTEAECLKCHGHQGYNEGDVRGGVSVSIPMAPYLANQRRQTLTYAVSLGLLWLLGFTGTVLASRQLKNRIGERDRAQAELQKAHDLLERKVAERTAELTETNTRLKKEISEHRQAEDALLIKTHDLRERIKELDCFYLISDLREKPGISLEEIFNGVVEILAASWQFPEISCARITMDGKSFETKNFRETPWKLASSILVNEIPAGSLEVCYLEERPESDEGPFLRQERKLINAVAVRLGRIINYTRAMKELQKVNEVLEERVQLRTRELEKRTEELNRLAVQLTLAEERERRRIAEILHDDLQQLLVAVKINLENVTMHTHPDKQAGIQKIHAMVMESLRKSRLLTAELSPPMLNRASMLPALEWLANFIQQNYGLKIELQAAPQVDIFREDIRVLLFRSVRELLLNAIKHACVGSVRLSMDRDDLNHVRISISDTGIGFDPGDIGKADNPGSGYGLLSIKERLAMLGGSLEINSAPGEGATCTLIVPLVQEERHPADEGVKAEKEEGKSAMLAAGAAAYLTKGSSSEALLAAVRNRDDAK